MLMIKEEGIMERWTDYFRKLLGREVGTEAYQETGESRAIGHGSKDGAF